MATDWQFIFYSSAPYAGWFTLFTHLPTPDLVTHLPKTLLMRRFKSILIGLILLIATSLMSLLSWMWQRNSHNINPLPIPANDIELSLPIEEDGPEQNGTAAQSATALATEQVLACADEQIQPALTEAIIKFERRYPKLNVKITYADSDRLLQDCAVDKQDMLLFARPISENTLAAIEKTTRTEKAAQQTTSPTAPPTTDAKDSKVDITPFTYTLKQEYRFEGALLTESNPALNLRNYLLSSVGQDTFIQFGYDSIDGYRNQVDDLFNPKMKSLSQKEETILPLVGE
jgi:hypothetical protein